MPGWPPQEETHQEQDESSGQASAPASLPRYFLFTEKGLVLEEILDNGHLPKALGISIQNFHSAPLK